MSYYVVTLSKPPKKAQFSARFEWVATPENDRLLHVFADQSPVDDEDYEVEKSMLIPQRSFRDRSLILLGAIGPLGFLPASGTVTVAIVGLPLFYATRGVSLFVYLPVLVAFTLASVWVHQRGDKILGAEDSGILVWDEIVGFLFAVIGLPFTWKTAVVAFLLERALDILKVWPARWVEDHCPGGWGVVGDDVVAGLYTLTFLHVLLILVPNLLV